MSFKVRREVRKGGLKAVKERVKTPGTVDVGIIDAGAHKDEEGKAQEITVAEIGFINEFGAVIPGPEKDIIIPERPFFRSTLKEERKNIISLQRKLVSKILSGDTTTEKALGLIGEYVANKVADKIEDLKEPENADTTKAAKFPRTNPLVDTGQLKNSIIYEVNR